MKLITKALEQWRAEWRVSEDPYYLAQGDALAARMRFYDFEESAALAVEAVSRNSWKDWLCVDYGEEQDPDFGGPPPHVVETSFLHNGQLRRAIVMVIRHKLTFHVDQGRHGIVCYPFCVDFRNRNIDVIMKEVREHQPDIADLPVTRAALEETLAWLCEACYGPDVWRDEEPPPLQPIFVNKAAADLILHDAMRSGRHDPDFITQFYGPVFRVALCTMSLLWADREKVHVQAPLVPRRHSRLHNREGRKQELPAHRTVTFTLLREVIRDRVETGEVREARERRRCRDHEVVAHWRTLRTGRVVPVRAHRRGDASLGSISRRTIVKPPPEEGA